HGEHAPRRHLAGDDGGARTGKRFIDIVARLRIILDRAQHALDRLLRAVAGIALAMFDVPERRFRSRPLPMPDRALAHGIPARLMLAVIVAAADDEARFTPDQMTTHLKANGLERRLYLADEPGRVPDIGNIAGKQRPGFAPVDAAIVGDLADRPRFT